MSEASVERAAVSAWPEAVFESSLLSGLDARGRRDVAGAGRLVDLEEGERLYEAGQGGDSFYVVVRGAIALFAVRRGEDADMELRRIEPGGVFGEEAVVPAPRRASAFAARASTVAEVPVFVFRRAAARAGTDVADRLESTLRRAATRDLIRTLALARDLADGEIEALLDAVRWHRFDRGQAIYREGDPASELWLVADGLVQLQVDDGDRVHVRAYLARGDFFGDAELELRMPRRAAAVASGPSLLASVPAEALRKLLARHPDLLARIGRISADQHAAQQAIVGAAAASHTQHVFRDLYRLKVARSLLTIDLEACVRCGHCSWACASVHDGATLLVRRGDKIVTRVDAPETLGVGALLGGAPAATVVPKSLMLPNSCQHCENPACMIDCPTGAIGRDPEGEVFIRDALCTGCAACAKACPWDNIAMAPRPHGAARPAGGAYPEIAIKCDLCREWESGPACVQACPTEAIFRMNPAEELADVRDLLGGPRRRDAARRSAGVPAWSMIAGAVLAATAIAVVGAVNHARGVWRSGVGWGWAAGVAAAIAFVALASYALPKRAVRWWMGARRTPAASEREAKGPVRSRLAGHFALHLAIGALGVGLAVAHAPWPIALRATPGSALYAAFLLASLSGLATAVSYRALPRALTRLERTASLPEDFARDRRALLDRLYREVSGKSDLVKAIFQRVLLPYHERAFGAWALLLSRRSLREEERALRARIDRGLAGRGADRLGGLGELVRIVVELRALVAQRWLQRVLRGGLVVHVAAFGVALVFLVVHVVEVLLGRGSP